MGHAVRDEVRGIGIASIGVELDADDVNVIQRRRHVRSAEEVDAITGASLEEGSCASAVAAQQRGLVSRKTRPLPLAEGFVEGITGFEKDPDGTSLLGEGFGP